MFRVRVFMLWVRVFMFRVQVFRCWVWDLMFRVRVFGCGLRVFMLGFGLVGLLLSAPVRASLSQILDLPGRPLHLKASTECTPFFSMAVSRCIFFLYSASGFRWPVN